MIVRGEIAIIDGIKIKTGERIDDNEREFCSCSPVNGLLELDERAGTIDDR